MRRGAAKRRLRDARVTRERLRICGSSFARHPRVSQRGLLRRPPASGNSVPPCSPVFLCGKSISPPAVLLAFHCLTDRIGPLTRKAVRCDGILRSRAPPCWRRGVRSRRPPISRHRPLRRQPSRKSASGPPGTRRSNLISPRFPRSCRRSTATSTSTSTTTSRCCRSGSGSRASRTAAKASRNRPKWCAASSSSSDARSPRCTTWASPNGARPATLSCTRAAMKGRRAQSRFTGSTTRCR